jgi:hypothetical protein
MAQFSVVLKPSKPARRYLEPARGGTQNVRAQSVTVAHGRGLIPTHMGAKLFAGALRLVLVFLAGPSSSGTFREGSIHKDRYVIRTFAPPSIYAPVMVKALLIRAGANEKY